MPNAISNAVGTARQFTPQPDASYQGRYREFVAAKAADPDYRGIMSMGDNLDRLSQAFQGYAVQHEKYLDAKGLREAKMMINGESEEAISKLNAIDAAQSEGYVDSLDNPYFRAYAEKLRGQFLSNKMRGEFDVASQEHPEWKSSPEELMKHYDKFANDWKDNITEVSKPENNYAFNMGFLENNMNEKQSMMRDWYKQKKQDDITLTSTSIMNDLNKNLMEIPTLRQLPDGDKKVQEAIQKSLDPARLMGLSLESRLTLVRNFLSQGVNSGTLSVNDIDTWLPEIVMQTSSDGKTTKLSDLVDMKGLHVDAINYLNRYNSELKDNFIEQYTGDYEGARTLMEETRYTDPDKYNLLAPLLPVLKTKQEQIERDIQKQHDRDLKAAQAGLRSSGSGYSRRSNGGRRYSYASRNPDGSLGGYTGHKLRNTSDVNEFITAVVNGANTIGGLPTDSYNVTPELYYPALKNEIEYLAKGGNFDAIYRLMGQKQSAAMRGALSKDFEMTFNTLRIGDDGHAVIDGKAQNLLNAFAQNPNAVKDLFGGQNYHDAYVLHTLTNAHPDDIQQAYDGFATWKAMPEEDKRTYVSGVKQYTAGYTLEGVDNLDPSLGTGTASLEDDAALQNALLAGAAIIYHGGANASDAVNMVGHDMATGYFQYRGALIPKYMLKGIDPADDGSSARENLLFSLAEEMTAPDGVIYDSVRIKFDPNTRQFTFTDPDHLHMVNGKLVHQWTRTEDYVLSGANNAPAERARQAELESTRQAAIEEQRRQEAEARAAEGRRLLEEAQEAATSGTVADSMNAMGDVLDWAGYTAQSANIPDIPYTGNRYEQYFGEDGGLQPDADSDYHQLMDEGQ